MAEAKELAEILSRGNELFHIEKPETQFVKR